ELTARLERDRAAASHVEQTDGIAVLDDRFPTEQMLHAFQQCTDAAAALVRDRVMAIDRKHELLVLGAEAELRSGLAARLEPRDELLARFDRRHVDLVASHTAVPTKGPRPYTATAREGNWCQTSRCEALLRQKSPLAEAAPMKKFVALVGVRLPRAGLQSGCRRCPPFLPCRSAALGAQNGRRTTSPAAYRVRRTPWFPLCRYKRARHP